eukprot:SAG11_NODE_19499_length_465_cov_1.245902_1_plen_98_part_10
MLRNNQICLVPSALQPPCNRPATALQPQAFGAKSMPMVQSEHNRRRLGIVALGRDGAGVPQPRASMRRLSQLSEPNLHKHSANLRSITDEPPKPKPRA